MLIVNALRRKKKKSTIRKKKRKRVDISIERTVSVVNEKKSKMVENTRSRYETQTVT